MLSRRSFCIRSVATTVAAITVSSAAEAKAQILASKGKGVATIPMDEASSRTILFDTYRKHLAELAEKK